MKQIPKVTIYCDGSCRENPGPGGWAAILQATLMPSKRNHTRRISGRALDTTNNRMEITAALKAMQALVMEKLDVEIVTDSEYVIGAMSGKEWHKNVDLLSQLESECRKHKVTWKWVKGHSKDIRDVNVVMNSEVNQLAMAESAKAMLERSQREVA